jgi:hypothetical protein
VFSFVILLFVFYTILTNHDDPQQKVNLTDFEPVNSGFNLDSTTVLDLNATTSATIIQPISRNLERKLLLNFLPS